MPHRHLALRLIALLMSILLTLMGFRADVTGMSAFAPFTHATPWPEIGTGRNVSLTVYRDGTARFPMLPVRLSFDILTALAADESPAAKPAPTDTPTPEPAPTDTPTPELAPTDTPTPELEPTDTPTPGPAPTETPTDVPIATPTPALVVVSRVYVSADGRGAYLLSWPDRKTRVRLWPDGTMMGFIAEFPVGWGIVKAPDGCIGFMLLRYLSDIWPLPTRTPTPGRTSTPTATHRVTTTPTVTATLTPTSTATGTATPSATSTYTMTTTPDATVTLSPSATSTSTPTATLLPTATATTAPIDQTPDTPTPVPPPTQPPADRGTATNTPTRTETRTPTSTPTPTSTATPTPTATSTPTATPTLTPTATRTPMPENIIYIEAESGQQETPMSAVYDMTASGCYYLTSMIDDAGTVVITFTVRADGQYNVWGRAVAVDSQTGPADAHDTLYYAFDEPPTAGSAVWQMPHQEWAWGLIGTFDLPAGNHYVMFKQHAGEGRLDAIIVTADGAYVPTGLIACEPPVEPTPTPRPTVPPLSGAGFYNQYDWPCKYPLVYGTLPDGRHMWLCPNGTDDRGNYESDHAFRTAGGMDWMKMHEAFPNRDVIPMGAIFWVSWADINPADGQYNWSVIDNYVRAAQTMQMEAADGRLVPKAVVIRLFNALTNLPALQPPVRGIDGGFIFDDYTPRWLKDRMRGGVAWGGPTVLSNGTVVSTDDGSYWVRTECVYTDLVRAHSQGSNWDYSIWVVPKYDHPLWQGSVKRMLADVASHYEGSGLVFMLGMNGMDGEYGNWLQFSYAGCQNLRQSALQQYPSLNSGRVIRDLAIVWRNAAPTLKTYMTCTSDCDPNTFINVPGMGIFQARAVPDSANFHRPGDIGVLDWAFRFMRAGKPVAWENAYGVADPAYIYQMLSLVAATYPDIFSFVGGSWDTDKTLLRSFLPYIGRTPADTPEIWWRAYWTCYGYPDYIDCPDDANDEGDWSQYQGWPDNIEAGIWTNTPLPFVNPWTMLTTAQRQHIWYRMLRRLSGSVGFYVDDAWHQKTVNGDYLVRVDFLDSGSGDITFSCRDAGGTMHQATFARRGSQTFVSQTALARCSFNQTVDAAGHNFLLSVSGNSLILHGVSITIN